MEAQESTTHFSTLSEAMNALKEKGYTLDFVVNDNIRLATTNQDNKVYSNDQVKVVEFHRFEGESDPGDMSVLYAIETNDGQKGLLVDAFGMNASRKVGDFVRHMELGHNLPSPNSAFYTNS